MDIVKDIAVVKVTGHISRKISAGLQKQKTRNITGNATEQFVKE